MRERERFRAFDSPAGLMGRYGMSRSESHRSYHGAATGTTQLLLARVPHEKPHGPMTIIRKMLEATTNVIKSRAFKSIVPLITHMHAWAERADAGNSCHAQPPTHLNGPGVSTKSKTKQAAIKLSVFVQLIASSTSQVYM